MKTLTINVTAEDLDKALELAKDPKISRIDSCPVALAAKRVLNSVYMGSNCLWLSSEYYLDTPPEAVYFAIMFDKHVNTHGQTPLPEPITFTIQVPDSLENFIKP